MTRQRESAIERAAQAAAALDHPHVARIYRLGRLPDETPYMVMRLVKGRTIRERLKAEGPLRPELAIPVLKDVASALTVTHAHDIVHRDIRPTNVLWDEKNDKALLVDFGIAALLATSGDELTRLTKEGQLLGDPRYLSPEELRDDDLTVLADIYGFGVMAYELLTGEGPYDVRTNTQLIDAHLYGEPRDLLELRPDIDPNIANVLQRCLNKDPMHRPAASDISRALEGEWQLAPIDDSGGDLMTIIAKKRVPQVVGAGFVISSAIIGGVATLEGQDDFMPPWAFTEALATGGAIIMASAVIGWFHGAKGRQEKSMTEYVALGMIGLAWLVASVAVVVYWG